MDAPVACLGKKKILVTGLTDRQTDRPTNRHTDKQTYGHADRQKTVHDIHIARNRLFSSESLTGQEVMWPVCLPNGFSHRRPIVCETNCTATRRKKWMKKRRRRKKRKKKRKKIKRRMRKRGG